MYYTVDMVTDSEEQTIEFAAQYARTLKKGDVVLLGGEMGAGKTVFVKGVAAPGQIGADDAQLHGG